MSGITLKKPAGKLIRRILRKFNLDLVRYSHEALPPDLCPDDLKVVQLARPLTMTTYDRLASMIDATRYICEHNIPGAIVECGVWRGGNMIAAALTLISEGCTSRSLFLYDTFEGMTRPSDKDYDYLGVSAIERLSVEKKGTGVWCEASIDDVRENIMSTGYSMEQVHFVIGPVENTLLHTVPESISLLRLDTDWYESTRIELEILYPRLNPGGVLIIDDYGHWKGANYAVDEYFDRLGTRPFFHRVDYTCRLIIKPIL